MFERDEWRYNAHLDKFGMVRLHNVQTLRVLMRAIELAL